MIHKNSYTELEYLEETSFIAGQDLTLRFDLYNESDAPIELSNACTLRWMLSPYGQPEYNLLEKQGIVISGTNYFTISLQASDTYILGGIYLQQIKVTDLNGKTYRAQGIINIQKAIQSA